MAHAEVHAVRGGDRRRAQLSRDGPVELADAGSGGLRNLRRIVFRGLRVRTGRAGHWRARMQERWARMTPEEREKFRDGMRARCGSFRQAKAEQPPAV